MKKSIPVILGVLVIAILLVPLNRRQNCADQDFLKVLSDSNSSLTRFTLDNGMICLIKEDHTAPVCSIQFWIGNGAIHEGQYLGSGISHAIEHMIFKGTDSTEPGELTSRINDAGGKINAYTGYDRTVFLTDLPSRNWRTGLDLLSEALMNPAFPAEEWTKEKNVILREIAMGYDDPNRVINKLLFRTAYSTHPYKYPIIGYEDTFTKLTRDDLLKFYKDNYVSDNIIAVVVGAIDSSEVRSALENTFKSFKRKSREPIVLPSEPKQVSPRFQKVTGSYKRSRLEWCYHTVSLTHPDAPALDILAIILGQGSSSRLSLKIKDELQLAESISAWSYTPKEAGIFGISAKFDPENEDALITAIEDEISAWTRTRLSRAEIAKAKRKILADQLSALATMTGQARDHASGEFYASDPLYSETYLKQISSVTPRKLLKTARKYLRPENRSLVILAPETHKKDSKAENNTSEISKPLPVRHILSNGMPLILYENNKLPFAYVCVAGLGGLLSENESNVGITRLMSDMLIRGTKNRTAEEISLTYDSLGGNISAFSGKNAFGLTAKFLSCDADVFMELIGECLTSPTFQDDELSGRKQLQLSAIKTNEESPFHTARNALRKTLFPGHPYQWDEYGTTETVENISAEDIRTHFEKLVMTGNLVISIAGNIDLERSAALAEKYLSRIPNKSFTLPPHSEPTPSLPAHETNFMQKEQAIILVGLPGIDVRDERYDTLELIQDAMSGLSSQLSTEIREKRGLAYYSGAYNLSGLEPGAYVLYAGTKPTAVKDIEKLMKDELERITKHGLSPEETSRAKNRIIAAHDMSLQSMSKVSFGCALNTLYGLGYDHMFSRPERFNSITSADIIETAKSLFSADRSAASIVLPDNGQ